MIYNFLNFVWYWNEALAVVLSTDLLSKLKIDMGRCLVTFLQDVNYLCLLKTCHKAGYSISLLHAPITAGIGWPLVAIYSAFSLSNLIEIWMPYNFTLFTPQMYCIMSSSWIGWINIKPVTRIPNMHNCKALCTKLKCVGYKLILNIVSYRFYDLLRVVLSFAII